jgi:hypothetical protein
LPITSGLKTEPRLGVLMKLTQNQCIYKYQKVSPVDNSDL